MCHLHKLDPQLLWGQGMSMADCQCSGFTEIKDCFAQCHLIDNEQNSAQNQGTDPPPLQVNVNQEWVHWIYWHCVNIKEDRNINVWHLGLKCLQRCLSLTSSEHLNFTTVMMGTWMQVRCQWLVLSWQLREELQPPPPLTSSTLHLLNSRCISGTGLIVTS